MRHERKKKKTCWSREKREKKSQRWALIYSFSKSIPILPDEKKQKQRRRKKRWWRGDTEAWPDRQAPTVGSFLSPYTHAWLNLFFFPFFFPVVELDDVAQFSTIMVNVCVPSDVLTSNTGKRNINILIFYFTAVWCFPFCDCDLVVITFQPFIN